MGEMEEMNAISRLPQNSEHRNNIAAIELHLIAEEKQKIEQLTQYLQIVKPAENFPHTNPVQNRPAWNNQNLIQQLMLTRAMDGSLPKMWCNVQDDHQSRLEFISVFINLKK